MKRGYCTLFRLCAVLIWAVALSVAAPVPLTAQQSSAPSNGFDKPTLNARVEQVFDQAYRKTLSTWPDINALILPPSEENYQFAKAVAHDPAALRAAAQSFLTTMEAQMAGQSGDVVQAFLFYWREIAQGLIRLADEIEAPPPPPPPSGAPQNTDTAEARVMQVLRQELAASFFGVLRAVQAFERGEAEGIPETFTIDTEITQGRITFVPDKAIEPDHSRDTSMVNFGSGQISFSTTFVGSSVDVAGLAGNNYVLDLGSGRFVEPPGVGTILQSQLEVDILIGVVDAASGTLTLMGAIKEDATTQSSDAAIPLPRIDFNASFRLFGPVDPNGVIQKLCVPNYEVSQAAANTLSLPTGSFARLWQCFDAAASPKTAKP